MGTVTARSLWMEERTHGYSHSEVTVDGGECGSFFLVMSLSLSHE